MCVCGGVTIGDCEARELTIAESTFVEIHFGDTARASELIRRDTQNVDTSDPNHCVLLHLVAGAQWARCKRKQGIPEIRKVLLEAGEWRRGEIKQARLSIEWRANRSGPMARGLRSLARDVDNA